MIKYQLSVDRGNRYEGLSDISCSKNIEYRLEITDMSSLVKRNVKYKGEYFILCCLFLETLCGLTTGVPNNARIVRGKDASSTPWQAVLLKRKPSSKPGETMFDLAYCGATLISERYLVTAAHCEPK